MKSHYTFNLRDVARVVGGVFCCTNLKVRDAGDLLAVFVHESHRVFRDRLVDEEDEKLFDELLSASYLKYFLELPVQVGDAGSQRPEGVEERDESEES